MLFRESDIVSKLHDPWTNHVTFDLNLLKRWINRRISSGGLTESLATVHISHFRKIITLRWSVKWCMCDAGARDPDP